MKTSKNGVKKIAVRVSGQSAAAYLALIDAQCATKTMLVEPGLTVYLLPDGTTIELYGAGAVYPNYLFEASDVVISYKVNNLQDTLSALQRTGANLLGEVVQACSTYCYCYVGINEHTIIGIFEEN